MIIKRNKSKMCLSRRPKNRKMSPTTKTVNCHSLTYLSYWRLVDTFHRYLSFLVLTLRYYLFKKYTVFRSISWARPGGGEGGGKDSLNLSHFYSSINYRCFLASSSRTLTMTLLFATRVLYFGPFRGVMKIRIAVTLVVLGYLFIKSC